MSTISVRLNDKDDTLICKYAKLHCMDLSSFILKDIRIGVENSMVKIYYNLHNKCVTTCIMMSKFIISEWNT